MSNRRFYWIKLKNTFMSSDSIDFLMSQKEGTNYVVLYQMICMMCINTDGLLQRQLNEVIMPYDIQKIQRDTKYFTIDTVRVALELYKNLGLIYENQDGILAITNFEEMVGSETQSTLRSRKSREQKALQCNTNATQMQQENILNCNIEKEIEKEIDIDKDNKTSCVPKGNDKKIKEDYFNEFWKLYPRKLNTKKSKEIFLKKCTDDIVFKEIIDGLKKHVEIEWRDKEIQFIPHATTWLNQERYKDEIVKKTNAKVLTLPQWKIDEEIIEVIHEEEDLELKEELKKRLQRGN